MPNTNNNTAAATPRIEIHLCVADDDEAHLPKRRRAPQYLPITAPLPRAGEYVYLTSTSSWKVARVVHEWRSPSDLCVQVWIEYDGPVRRRGDFTPTQ